MRTPSPTSGFTLIEMMIVVIIIGIVAALAAPAASLTMAKRRAGEAIVDVVRLARNARSESVRYGRAHLVQFNADDRGSIEVYRGINGGCNTNDWDTVLAQGGCADATSMCTDRMVISSGRYDMGAHELFLTSPAGDTMQLCYEPTGIMQWRTVDTNRFTDRTIDSDGFNLGGGIQFRIMRRLDGADVGVARWAVLPLSADPRLRR